MIQKAFMSLLFVALLLVSGSSWAQRKSKNLPFYDDKFLHYGFQIGLHNANYAIQHSDFFAKNGDSTQYVTPLASPGFSLGFILNFRMKDELWALRILPSVGFYERKVLYGYPQSIHEEQFESTFLEIPVLIKYKSVRRTNFRMYMTGGFMLGYEVGNKRDALTDNSLSTEHLNFEIQYGVGADIYFDMFKFSPELRFSHGLTNMMVRNNNRYDRQLQELTTHKVAFYLNFE
jgi:Outer membrane protein beta-barrel domain